MDTWSLFGNRQEVGICFSKLGGVSGWGGGGVCREKEPLRNPLAGSWAGLCCARGVNWLAGAGDRERVPFSPRTLSCSPAGFGP